MCEPLPLMNSRVEQSSYQYDDNITINTKGKITEALMRNLLSWPYSGFHIHQGERIEIDDRAGRERVAAYISGNSPK